MNIAVLSHRLPFPPNKGEKIRTYNQLDHLRLEGCKVTLFCMLESQEDIDLAKQYEHETGFTIVGVKSGFQKLAMLIGLFSGRAFSVSNFYNRALQKHFNDFAKNNPIDTIFCTSSSMAEYVFKGDLRIRNPHESRRDLVDFMDLDSDKWRQYREISSFPMSLVYLYEETMLARYESKIQQRFDECIFISSNETILFAQQLDNQAKNLKVIGNGVDLTAFRPPNSPRQHGAKKLLFSGVMDYLPNENAMLWFVENVWPKLTTKHPDVQLVIAGMNPTPSIKKLGEDKRITVTGFVDDMLVYYHEANVFVAPFQIARGVQNKILQSFACGLPVVTTPIGAEGIDCHDGTDCLIASNPHDFVEKINILFEDKGCYENISANATKLVNDHFTWDASNRKLFELFHSPNDSQAG